jgi:RNA polymerase sigma-70 factor (ECF subfamily)
MYVRIRDKYSYYFYICATFLFSLHHEIRERNRDMDEKLIIDACVRGESWACKRVYELYAPTMMSLCMRYVGNRETARDLLQDGFLRVFTHIHTYSYKGAFAGWIYRIFVTTSLEYLRKTDALKLAVDIMEYNEQIEDIDVSVLDRLSEEDLMECIAKLPPGYRTVFNMYVIEGYSHREIAEALGISVTTSKTQFLRARTALQKSVKSLMNNHKHVR